MASHKFSSSNHVPISRNHPSMNEHSSFPIHTSSYLEPSVRTLQRKGSLPLLQSVSDNVVYVSPHYSAQDLPPAPSSPGKLVQKYMEHMDVHPTSTSQRKQHRGSLGQDQFESVHQDLPSSVQSLKATALVAPYVGDSSYKLPISRFGDLEGSVTHRGKPKMAESTQGHVDGNRSSDKWKTLVETKDNLLAQKNHLIDRQKATIGHLQAQLQSMEAQSSLQRATSLRATADSALTARLRELEHKNAALQAELASLHSTKRRENQQLSHKLDANEFELHKKTVDFSKRQEELQTESEQLHQQMADKTSSLKELEHKLHVYQDKNKELSQHIVKLNGYFENMPTMEEYLALQEHTQHQDKLCSSLTDQLANKDEQLNTALAKLKGQEASNADLEQTCKDLRQQLDSARGSNAEMSKLLEEKTRAVTECTRLQKMLFGADKHCQRELEAMRQRHKARFQEATADLRVKHKAVVKRMKVLEAQLLRNSDTMLAVNEELQLNQGAVTNLKSSMKELLGQNQELVEKNITLQEKEPPDSQIVKAQQVAIELTHCVKDFRSLIDLSSSLMEEKFTSSHLFGNPDSDDGGHALASETDLAFSEGYDALLEQGRHLKRDIETLREFVSEQLAIQVSTACHVQ